MYRPSVTQHSSRLTIHTWKYAPPLPVNVNGWASISWGRGLGIDSAAPLAGGGLDRWGGGGWHRFGCAAGWVGVHWLASGMAHNVTVACRRPVRTSPMAAGSATAPAAAWPAPHGRCGCV